MSQPPKIRVADEVWIAAASLHRRRQDTEDFEINEILAQAEAENVTGVRPLRPGVKIHIYLHCVANKPPNPGRYCMLVETKSGRRRLFRPGDSHHVQRTGKTVPRRDEIPAAYRELIDWYEGMFAIKGQKVTRDPILGLRGLGKEIWADEDADEYVRRQRRDWR